MATRLMVTFTLGYGNGTDRERERERERERRTDRRTVGIRNVAPTSEGGPHNMFIQLLMTDV